MPREFHPLVREGGYREAEKFYILSYEGTTTEKKYFADLRNSIYFNDSGVIETIPLKRSVKQGSNPISVKQLLKEAKKEYNYKSTDEFWLIIDRDDWEHIHHINFDSLIEECDKEKNFFMALSNPCFELWLLLHLTRLDSYSEEELQLIYANKKISDKKNYIGEVLANCIADGRGYNKKPNPKIFLPKIYTAIKHARELALPHERYPKGVGSDVYKLVEKLVKPTK